MLFSVTIIILSLTDKGTHNKLTIYKWGRCAQGEPKSPATIDLGLKAIAFLIQHLQDGYLTASLP